MTALAWAIVILAVLLSNAIHVYKFGDGYKGVEVAAFTFGIAFIICIICTALELRR